MAGTLNSQDASRFSSVFWLPESSKLSESLINHINVTTMRYLVILVTCLAILSSVFCDEDIHEFMSFEEHVQTFLTDLVPDYEIVEIQFSERLHKRDISRGSKMHIKAFGEDINLWLHPTESILAGDKTPVYYASDAPHKPEGVDFWRRDDLMGMVGRMYEDPRKMASMVIGTEESGRTRISGFIESENLAVRSLPNRVAEEYARKRRSVADSDQMDSTYHVVFKIPDTFNGDYEIPPFNVTVSLQDIVDFSDEIPDTIYPEVLVIVDYSMHKAYGHDIYGLLEYILAFWNGVDLKYRSLESPNVRFHISGIVLADDPYALTYISRNQLTSESFESSAAMVDATRYWYKMKDTFPSDSYDFTVTMSRQEFGGNGIGRILGKAWVGTACSFSDSDMKTHGIALILDNGVFSGISVAAHEIGHLFGSKHDGSQAGCSYSDGFLMSVVTHYTKNSSDFSRCSLADFNNHLNSTQLDCLFNQPAMDGKVLPKIMPGRVRDLDSQCKSLKFEASCESKIYDVCESIHCLDQRGRCLATGHPAIDGSICATNPDKFCLHQRCVSL